MLIQCPSCRFQREVPSSAVQPGRSYKVTCPRCSAVFHFSLPEEEEKELEPLQESLMAGQEASAAAEEEAGQTVSEGASCGNGEDASPATQEMAAGKVKPSDEKAPVPDDVVARDDAEARPENVDMIGEAKQGDAYEHDPLPPGATIPRFDNESLHAEPEKEEEKEPEETTLLDRWLERQDEDPVGTSRDGRPAGAPWESPEFYGFWGSFSRTLLGVMLHAPAFFRNVRCTLSPLRPILFYVLLSLFQMLASRLWYMKALRELTATTTEPQTLAMAENLMQSMNMPLMLLITPFFSIFQVVFLAGIYHIMIRLVQPDRAEFATVLRVVCYSAAPMVFCIVPMFGSLIASIWFVVSTFIGCKYALDLPWGRTILALLPLYILELAFVSQIPALMTAM